MLSTIRGLAGTSIAAITMGCAGSAAITPPTKAVPIVVAHRGSSYSAPEHTFAAYDLAVAEGADYIEQDIQRTRDGVLVVIHDATLDRTVRGDPASCGGLVSEKTLAELKTCDAGSWFNSTYPSRARADYAGLRIPTLVEVIERYGSRARYYIEMKDPGKFPGIEADLMAVLTSHGLTGPAETTPRVIVQSFDAASLTRFNELDPRMIVVQLAGQQSAAGGLATLESMRPYASGFGPHRADVDRTLVEEAHARGFVVHPYTIDDPVEMNALLDLKVDGMFTNRPALLRDVISIR